MHCIKQMDFEPVETHFCVLTVVGGSALFVVPSLVLWQDRFHHPFGYQKLAL